MYNFGLTPGVYNVAKLNENEIQIGIPNPCKYRLVRVSDRFTLPDKLYGNVERTAIRVWNTFALSGKSTGILLTGESGSGKSLLGEVISNLAISKGIPVVFVTVVDNEKMTSDLLAFLSRLDKVVMFLDEYGKFLPTYEQHKMLPFFSDTTTKKLFIITDNNKYNISSFIRDRPGRVRYHIDYAKVPKDILLDYLNKNVENDEKFKEEVYELYTKCRIFSFDHLQTIVSEHMRFPEDKLNDIVNILNLGALQNPVGLKVKSIKLKASGEYLTEYRITSPADYERWASSESGYVTLSVQVDIPAETIAKHNIKVPMSSVPFASGETNAKHYQMTIAANKCKYSDEIWTYSDEILIVELTRGELDNPNVLGRF